jgi:hypothetical protein
MLGKAYTRPEPHLTNPTAAFRPRIPIPKLPFSPLRSNPTTHNGIRTHSLRPKLDGFQPDHPLRQRKLLRPRLRTIALSPVLLLLPPDTLLTSYALGPNKRRRDQLAFTLCQWLDVGVWRTGCE